MHVRTLVLPLLVCAACDGGSSPPPPAVTPSVAITADNALAAAGAAWHVAFDPVQVARIAALFLEVPPPEPPEPPQQPGGGAPAVVVQELAGPEGGTAILTWDDRDADLQRSTGDAFAVVFADYGDSSLVLTGAVSFEDVVVDGDLVEGLSWTLDATLRFTGLRLVDGETITTLSGAFRCARDKRLTVRTLSLAPLDRPQLGVRTLAPTSALARNDYVLDFTMGLFAEGSFDDALLGGTLTFTTEAPLTGLQVLRGPSAGLLKVEGANGSTVGLQAIDFFTLELLVDENGDGETDATIPAEWSAVAG